MDYAELFHCHGIPIRSLLDLQLADNFSRLLHGEKEEDQRRRLSPYLKRGEVDRNFSVIPKFRSSAALSSVSASTRSLEYKTTVKALSIDRKTS